MNPLAAELSNRSSWRTVISAWSVMNAVISLTSNLVPSTSAWSVSRVAASRVAVSGDGVGAEEQVGRVVVELGPLGLVQGVFDGQLVQAELGVDHGEVGGCRLAQVQPHDRCRVAEVPGDVSDGDVVQHAGPVPVQPGPGPGLDPDRRTDSLRSPRFGSAVIGPVPVRPLALRRWGRLMVP
jgi:hypothetical protein